MKTHVYFIIVSVFIIFKGVNHQVIQSINFQVNHQLSRYALSKKENKEKENDI